MYDVIVATRNRSAWLEESLRSTLASAAQAGVVPHVLVVDDASDTPATRDVAEAVGVAYVRLPSSVGCAAARVVGVEQTSGEFLCFFDDDDVMLPNWFALHIAAMREADVVAGSYWRTDAELRYGRRKTLAPARLDDFLHGRVTVNDFALIRRSVLEGIRWQPELGTVMLMALWTDLGARGCRFAAVSEPTFLYRRHSANLSDHLDSGDAERRLRVAARFAT